MIPRYYVPAGVSVGKPAGGIYCSGYDVPQEDIEAFGEDRVARMVGLGRLAIHEEQPEDEVESRPEREGRTGRVSPGKWDRDPSDLWDSSLDELNVMVLEIDDSTDLFETVEEAVFFLSQDFIPEKQEA